MSQIFYDESAGLPLKLWCVIRKKQRVCMRCSINYYYWAVVCCHFLKLHMSTRRIGSLFTAGNSHVRDRNGLHKSRPLKQMNFLCPLSFWVTTFLMCLIPKLVYWSYSVTEVTKTWQTSRAPMNRLVCLNRHSAGCTFSFPQMKSASAARAEPTTAYKPREPADTVWPAGRPQSCAL